MRTFPHKKPRQTGFSLIELMVSITIGLFLLAGATSLLVTSKGNYQVNDDLARIQENARIAMEYLSRDLRMAGYFGCADNISSVYDHINDPITGSIYDTSNPIEGYETDAIDNVWEPSKNASQIAQIYPGTGTGTIDPNITNTDAITIRYLQPSNITLTAAMPQPSAVLKISTPNDLKQGEIVGVTDCSSSDIIQISGPNGPNIQTTGNLVHNTGNATSPGNINLPTANCPGGAANCLSKIYAPGAQILRFVAYRYYIGNDEDIDEDGDGNPANDGDADNTADPVLVRAGINVNGTTAAALPVELVDGVERMQITYGIDTTGDRIPDTYISANGNSGGTDLKTANGWLNVVSVRVGLLMASSEAIATDFDNNTYVVNGLTVCETGNTNAGCNAFHAIDRKRRKVFTSTILLRNLQ